jgi:hypothetical protein
LVCNHDRALVLDSDRLIGLAMLRTRLPDDHDPNLVGQRQRIAQTRQTLQAAVAGSSREPRAV